MNALRLAATVVALTAMPAAAASLVIENAWIRLPAPSQSVAAGYCDLRNDGAVPVTVVGFAGPFRVEMHETRVEDGVARMRRVRELNLPAKSAMQLAPGGKHLMLFGVDAASLGAGPVTFHARLASGEEIPVAFAVRAPGAAPETRVAHPAVEEQQAKP